MAFYELTVKEKNPFRVLEEFFKSLLSNILFDFVVLPLLLPYGKGIAPTLVGRAEDIEGVNIFLPYLPFNSASVLAEASLKNQDKKIGAVLRSCEIRAVVELSKLKQLNLENLYLIGVDCLGTYESRDFQKLLERFESTSLTEDFLSLSKETKPKESDVSIRLSCSTCEYPVSFYLDMGIHFLGYDCKERLLIQAKKDFTDEQRHALALKEVKDISLWQQAKKRLEEQRIKRRDELFKELDEAIKGPDDFLKLLEHCRRCYNCRKECPICYCRECIFESETFSHTFEDYLRWAKRKGKVRLPADTILFHLTRMNHMVSSCVACGQCSSACPNEVGVGRLFKFVGKKVQALFDYVPGKDPQEELPQATFKEDEFVETER